MRGTKYYKRLIVGSVLFGMIVFEMKYIIMAYGIYRDCYGLLMVQ